MERSEVTTDQGNETTVRLRRSSESDWCRGLSAAILLLVLAQAVLAGQFLYAGPGALSIHRVVAEVLPILSLSLLVVLWIELRNGSSMRRSVAAVSLAVFALIVIQTGLGFVGRSTSGAAAIHVPLGVVIFGLTIQNALAIWSRPEARTEARGASHMGRRGHP